MVAFLNVRGSLSHSRITYFYDLDQYLGRAAKFLMYGYPAYLVVRFVAWSVKTLREKPNEVTTADGGWRSLFAFIAQWPAAAEFLR